MDKQKEILSAALRLFVEQGFHGTPTSKIAREAGVANGTLFHYFPTKDDLVINLYLEVKAQMTADIMRHSGTEKSLKAQLRNYYTSSLAWALENRMEFHYIRQFHTSPYARMVDTESVNEQADNIVALLRKGIEKGQIKKMETDLIIAILGSYLFGINQYLINGNFGKKKQQAIMEASFDLLWDMIT